jgi:hypothetical protein
MEMKDGGDGEFPTVNGLLKHNHFNANDAEMEGSDLCDMVSK